MFTGVKRVLLSCGGSPPVEMRRLSSVMTLVFVVGACVAVFAQASRQQDFRFRGSDGWGVGSRYEQLFDNMNVRTMVGAVVRVDTSTPIPREMSVGVRVVVNLDGGGEEVPIHIGPQWFAAGQDVNFPRGERIEIRGFRASLPVVGEFIMPVEIRSRHRIFRFRDEDGFPFWSVIRPR